MKKLILYLIGFTFSISANSQDSLMLYLGLAAKNNPVVLQRYNEYQAALQKVPQVGSLPDPQLEMGVFLSPMELMAGNQVADIKLMQMFPWFGVIKNAKDEMSLMAKASYETFRDAKLQVYYDLQRNLYDLYKVKQNIRISEKNIDLLKTIERLTLLKFKTGTTSTGSSATTSAVSAGNASANSGGSSQMNTMGGNASPSVGSSGSMAPGPMGSSSGSSGLADVYRIQIEIGDLENNIALLKSQQNTLQARFNSFLNRPMTTAVSVPEILSSESLDISYLTVSDSMFTTNPMLTMLQYEQQSLEARRKMIKQMGYPMVGVGLNYSVISKSEMSTSPMNGQDMIMPMLTFTLPIYRKKYKAMQTETNYMQTATQQSYQATANSLQADYYEALQNYTDAQRRMKLYANQSVLAQKSLDILIKTFSSSNSNLTDILRIRQQLFDYEYKQVEALSDFNTAVAWMKRLNSGSTAP